MLAELVILYALDRSIPDGHDIREAVKYVQEQAKKHDLEFPIQHAKIRFTIDPVGVPSGFVGFRAVAYAATNLDPCLIVFVEPSAARRQSVIRHEIMHCLGVPHSPYKHDLMFSTGLNKRFSERELKRWKRIEP